MATGSVLPEVCLRPDREVAPKLIGGEEAETAEQYRTKRTLEVRRHRAKAKN